MENENLKEFASFLIGVGGEKREVKTTVVQEDINNAQVALIPQGMEAVDLKKYLPGVPSRKRISNTFVEAASFIAYVNEHKNASTRIFAQITGTPVTFKAVIDYHGVDGKPAGWCEHTAIFRLDYDERFDTWRKAWFGEDAGSKGQEAFVEFLKDNRLDVVDPDGATLMETISDLELTSNQKCASKVPTNSGVRLIYEDDVRTNVMVPDKIKLRFPIFAGGEDFELDAELRFKQMSADIRFAVRFLQLARLIRETVKAMAEQVKRETNVPVYIVATNK
jgi:uncharacterized protein YfdQ (DUF2303 family)